MSLGGFAAVGAGAAIGAWLRWVLGLLLNAAVPAADHVFDFFGRGRDIAVAWRVRLGIAASAEPCCGIVDHDRSWAVDHTAVARWSMNAKWNYPNHE